LTPLPRSAAKFRLIQPPVPKEDAEHKTLARSLALFLGPPGVTTPAGVLWCSIEHRNARSAAEGARRKACGVVGGIPDVALFWGRRVIWVELKRQRDGTLSPSQKIRHPELRRVGHSVLVARGAEHALALLAAEGIPLRGYISA
jgi:hypothetical protein